MSEEVGKQKGSRISPEARQKLSDLAKQRHAEGKFGGSKYGKMGGRPRKVRASQRVAEAAEGQAKEIIAVFKDAIDDSQPMSTRLKGAEAWLGVEQLEGKLALQEEVADAKQHSREELIEILAQRMTSGPQALVVRQAIERQTAIVDADVVGEVDDALGGA